jgi:hypothetical protein
LRRHTSLKAAPATLKTDGSINGVVKDTTDPKGPTVPDLEYQTRSQHSDIDDLTRRDYPDTEISMELKMHYTGALAYVDLSRWLQVTTRILGYRWH